ncbi:phosphatase PAP2 family protein [Skermanella rosea]|uniref:vanadium-dependent haloperoxidase n=1 Tax=Skermanella rosea TaxID=1817965 RepID=UPI0019344581|nr:vanadium-dependent haloperoxidase [Skermanella rosea]UEM02557.1 phosphatase PAP2 family protein [Skermanella rosea]
MIADPILFWNDVSLEVHRRDFSFEEAPSKGHGSKAYMDQQVSVPEQGGPTRTSRALAIVHLAMHDAWIAYRDQGTRYHVDPVLPLSEVDTDGGYAAVGEAAAMTLTALYPRQAAFIRSKCQEWTALIADIDPAQSDRGAIFGAAVGKLHLEDRRNDGSEKAGDYMVAGTPGAHQPDPYAPDQGFLTPAWGEVRPFIGGGPVPGIGPFGLTELSDVLKHADWHREVEETRTKGGAPGTPGLTRTAEETIVGIFWGYDGVRHLGTPPRLYNQCVRTISKQAGLSPTENARLFALVNMTMADAGIAAWKLKYEINLCRPVIGVREAARGYGKYGNSSPATFAGGSLAMPVPDTADAIKAWLAVEPVGISTRYHTRAADPAAMTPEMHFDGDPTWRPLGAPQTNDPGKFHRTPNFPAYPSGHATFGAACFMTVYHFLKARMDCGGGTDPDTLAFAFTSDEFNGVNGDPDGSVRPRHMRKMTLAQAIHENAVSRVYLGVHWRIDAIEGVRLGQEIARQAATMIPGPGGATATIAELKKSLVAGD